MRGSERIGAVLSALLLLTSLLQGRAYSVASFSQTGSRCSAGRLAGGAHGGILKSIEDRIPKNDPSARDRIKASQILDMAPLYFQPNAGQNEPKIKFSSRINGLGFSITESGAILSLTSFKGSDPGPRIDQANGSPIAHRGSGRRVRGIASAFISISLARANRRPLIEGTVDYSKPAISQTGIDGKTLTVSGRHFRMGALLAINGNEVATAADPTNPRVLVAQQGVTKIKAAQTAFVQVVNADGTFSDPHCVSLPPPP
jgi:hypothetical protein